MKWMQNLAIAATLAALTLGGVACEKEEPSPLEKAGEALGDAMEDAGDAIEDAGDKIKDATKDKD